MNVGAFRNNPIDVLLNIPCTRRRWKTDASHNLAVEMNKAI